MEEVKMKTGEPLQIIDFKLIDGKKQLVLNYENLKSILKSVEDLPISLLSITGASRLGKSFLLSFIIRYLEALKIDESDWIGWENQREALVGFKWRDGIHPETSGMWLWSEPFIVQSNEEKIGILLMDTQGTFDEFTTEREWSTIVGLSLLMSSCTIFNCLGNVQEDALNTLETYVQYGVQALQLNDMGEERPFQKLMFLVRDWNMPSQFAYGLKGGSQFLKEKFKLKEGQPEQAQRVRRSIQGCFEAIECFLMPDPGDKAKEKDFNGAIVQLAAQYTKKIENFITELLNPDEILRKTVFGSEASGQDIFNCFVTYVEIFNGDELPELMSIFEATAQLSNQSLIQKAKKIFIDNMKKKQRGNNFLTERKFSAAVQDSEKKANDFFKKSKKLGNEGLIIQAEEVFQEEIQKEGKSLQLLNSSKREKEIMKAINDAVSTYKDKMEDEFNPEEFLEEKKLFGLSEVIISGVVDDFSQKIEDEEPELEKLVAELKVKLEGEKNVFKDRNQLKRKEMESFMGSLVDDILRWYEDHVKDDFDESETLKVEDLENIEKPIHEKSIKRFSEAEKKGDRGFVTNYKKTLEERMGLKSHELMKNYLSDKEKKILKVGNLISELVNEFKSKLSLEIDVAENEEFLLKKEKEFGEEATETFDTDHCFLERNEVVDELEEQLKSKLKIVFESEILEKYRLKLKESEQSFTIAYGESLSIYSKEMEEFTKTCEFHAEASLQTQHDKSIRSAFDTYNKHQKLGKNITERDEMMFEKLEIEVEESLKRIMEQNDLRKSNVEEKCQNDVTECLKEYHAEMKIKLEMARDEEKLKEYHTIALEEAKKSFKTKCPIKDEDFMENYLAKIEEEIDETFDEILELYKLKLAEQSVGTEKALAEAKRFYHEEMAKHYSNTRFMRPKELQELHEKVLKKSIDQCSATAPLTPLQKEDLESSLQVTFKMYEEQNNMNVPVDPAIGIDLGTTYSCVSVYFRGKVEVIPNKEGKKTTPSYVAFKDGTEMIGEAAKNQAHENPENTIFDAKRMIGRRMDDTHLQNDIKLWPFKVVKENEVPKVEVEGRTLFPEQISAKVLQEMRVISEAFLGCPITKAVITVPAYFTDGQRQATIDAGEIAGLKVLKILDEPIAAAIAYKLQHMDNDNRNVLIFDLGGGTFDVAVLEMSKGVIEVKAKDGDTHLGGEDFDNNLVEHCALDFQASVGVDILEGRDSPNIANRRKCLKAMRRVRNESERRKIDLASAQTVDIVVDSVDSGHDLNVSITRYEFESMNNELFEKTIKIVDRVLLSAGKGKGDIHDIVLVGGSTRIPKIQQLLSDYFGGKALSKTIDPDEAVARGAAIQAAILNGEIAKESRDFNDILDTAPYSMGVEVFGGDLSVIIPKNHRIPCDIIETYRTARDMQTSVRIAVFQGEKQIANENTPLGEFVLDGIPAAEKGREVIKILMRINEQGVLEVTATCASSGISKTGLTVNEQKWRLGREEIKRLLAEGNHGTSSGGL